MLSVVLLPVFAQVDTSLNTIGFDTPPTYNGGDKAIYNFIRNTIEYPQLCVDSGIEGKVYVGFTVTADGHVKNAQVIKGVCPLLNEEAIRVVNLLPGYSPGIRNGQPTDIYQTIPVNFKIAQRKYASCYYKPISVCDVWPQYPGGDDSLEDYFYLKTPVYNGQKFDGQDALVCFKVDSTGAISHIRVLNDSMSRQEIEDEYYNIDTYRRLSDLVDGKITRLIEGLKPFKPAMLNGKPIDVYVIMRWTVSRYYNGIMWPTYPLKEPPEIFGGNAFLFSKLNRGIPKDPTIKDGYCHDIFLNFKVDTFGKIHVLNPDTGVTKYHPAIYKHAIEALRSIKRRFVPALDSNGHTVEAYYNLEQPCCRKGKKYWFENYYTILSKADSVMILSAPEKEAEFPGGKAALVEYIKSHVIYPDVERVNGSVGRTVVRFVIDEEGRVSNPQIWLGLSKPMNDESIRVVSSLPRFTPATHYGQAVKSYYYTYVSFRFYE